MTGVGKEAVSLCGRCAAHGKTCCQGSEVFVTLGDLRRLAAAGHKDFHCRAIPADPDYLAGAEGDPAWRRIFSADGERRILVHHPNGDCLFLGSGGCRLEPAARPLICRLYPYEYSDAAIKGVSGHLCPEPERRAPALLLASLSMNRETAEECRAALYREIREEFPD